MCGPFVGYYSMGARTPYRNHLAYQTGRLVTYLTLGSLAGFLGRGVFYLGAYVNAQRTLMVLMGLMMIGAGIYYLLPGHRTFGRGISSRIGLLMRNLTGERNAVATAGLIGLCSTLMPCGFLYAFALAAGATGHPVSAMTVMFGFWLGTLPSLLGLGFVLRYCSQRFLQKMQKLTPIFLILFGLMAISGKWQALPGSPEDGPHCQHQELMVQNP